MDADRLDRIDAELCELNPTWLPLDAATKAAIRSSAKDALPLRDDQRVSVARRLRGSRHWRETQHI